MTLSGRISRSTRTSSISTPSGQRLVIKFLFLFLSFHVPTPCKCLFISVLTNIMLAALQDAFDTHPRVEWLWCLDSDAIIMNSTIDVWDLVLSSEAMLREVRTSAEIRFGGEKKLPEHEATVHTPSVVHPDDIYLIIADDSYGLK